MKYSIVIQWSEEDPVYVVSLPDFGPYAHTHGSTYEEAFQNAQEGLTSLVEQYRAMSKTLPVPKKLQVA